MALLHFGKKQKEQKPPYLCMQVWRLSRRSSTKCK